MSDEYDQGTGYALNCKCKQECIGFFGSLFGHSLKKYLIKEKYKEGYDNTYNIEGFENIKDFIESQRNIYIVLCKRCGFNPMKSE